MNIRTILSKVVMSIGWAVPNHARNHGKAQKGKCIPNKGSSSKPILNHPNTMEGQLTPANTLVATSMGFNRMASVFFLSNL